MALSPHALTTLQTVKDELGITDNSQDSVLERQINAASDAIRRYCSRVFYYQTGIVEKKAGFGTTDIVLERIPVTSVTSVALDDITLDSTGYEIKESEAGIIYREATWSWSAIRQNSITQDFLPGTEEKNITVTYTGGYITPQQAIDDNTLTRNLSYDLEEACILAVTAFYQRRGKSAEIKKESLMSASYEYDNSTGLPMLVLDMIKPYKRVVMV